MNVMIFPFMLLAACGLVLSVAAHCMALAGLVVPGGNLVWGLHIGIFVVWLPAVLVSNRTTRNANRKDFWKVALAGCPVWMRRGFYILFGYAILNFVTFMATTVGGHKHQRTGGVSPSDIRGFSGHWMVFYAAAFAILYSASRNPLLYRKRKCPNGHTVECPSRFCPDCGSPLSYETEDGRL